MSTLPPSGILRAAARWADLLQRSTLPQATAMLQGRAEFADLTWTQYASGLDLLTRIGALKPGSNQDAPLQIGWGGLSVDGLRERLLLETLLWSRPSWLGDADELVPNEDAIPEDLARVGEVIGLTDSALVKIIRGAWARVDTAERERVGQQGELALADTLRQAGAAVDHVALRSDAHGYDLVVSIGRVSWELEVKSTTRRGRLVIYLSRHEWEVGRSSPAWRLVAVGLDSTMTLRGVAVVTPEAIVDAAPRDTNPNSRWETVRVSPRPSDLARGMTFLPSSELTAGSSADLLLGLDARPDYFAWMPGDAGRTAS